MSYVEYTREGPLAVIILNRPEKLNAINPPMARTLAQAWIDFEHDREASVAILSGHGRAFCVGIDIKDRAERIDAGLPGTAIFAHDLPDLYMKPLRFGLPGVTKPVICAVNGPAFGVGLILAVHSDLRVASEHASFALPEIKMAMPAGSPRLTAQGLPLTMLNEMVLTGDPIGASRAYELGFVNKVVAGSELMVEARGLAGRLLRHSPMALKKAKLLNLKFAMPSNEAAEILASKFTSEAFASHDNKEAVRSFVEKRAPKFTGN